MQSFLLKQDKWFFKIQCTLNCCRLLGAWSRSYSYTGDTGLRLCPRLTSSSDIASKETNSNFVLKNDLFQSLGR